MVPLAVQQIKQPPSQHCSNNHKSKNLHKCGNGGVESYIPVPSSGALFSPLLPKSTRSAHRSLRWPRRVFGKLRSLEPQVIRAKLLWGGSVQESFIFFGGALEENQKQTNLVWLNAQVMQNESSLKCQSRSNQITSLRFSGYSHFFACLICVLQPLDLSKMPKSRNGLEVQL